MLSILDAINGKRVDVAAYLVQLCLQCISGNGCEHHHEFSAVVPHQYVWLWNFFVDQLRNAHQDMVAHRAPVPMVDVTKIIHIEDRQSTEFVRPLSLRVIIPPVIHGLQNQHISRCACQKWKRLAAFLHFRQKQHRP